MSIYDLFHLMGGLALFLYGMHIMGDSLEKRAGKKLRPILEQLTRSPIKGVMLGAGVTAVIQSSSATTVMVVGFVNSGIMHLRQAIPVIMGANIGTTVTPWILSLTGIRSDSFIMMLLKPATFSPILAFVGIVMLMASKRKRDTAGILLGFAVLMYGMELMSASVSGLAQVPAFRQLMVTFSNPLLGALVGAVVTAIIQSSSASVGILQAIANTGTLGYAAALPIIMGQNIGTCVTALLSSIGANRNAKRVAMVHLYFNLIGTVVFLSLFYLLDGLIGFTFMDRQVSAFGIAVTHTTFNLFTTSMLFPFISGLEWLARKTIRDDKRGDKLEMLDERLLNTPTVAIQQCSKLTKEMAQLAQRALVQADTLLDGYDAKVAQEVATMEDMVDQYEDRLGGYLVQVSSQSLSAEDSREVSKLLHAIGDFERISDHAVNLSEVAEELYTKGISFSPEAIVETRQMRGAVREVLNLAVDAFVLGDIRTAAQVEPLEEVIDMLRTDIKANHVERLRTGVCTIELGFVLGDLLHNLERVGDHCSNIAASVIEMESTGRVDTHQMIRELRSGAAGEQFEQLYQQYVLKYGIPRQ